MFNISFANCTFLVVLDNATPDSLFARVMVWWQGNVTTSGRYSSLWSLDGILESRVKNNVQVDKFPLTEGCLCLVSWFTAYGDGLEVARECVTGHVASINCL